MGAKVTHISGKIVHTCGKTGIPRNRFLTIVTRKHMVKVENRTCILIFVFIKGLFIKKTDGHKNKNQKTRDHSTTG